MNKNFDIVVVSLFGRGHWMAAELAQLGFSTALFEISENFGPWAPEDAEGPFGFFQSEIIESSMMARLHEEDDFVSIDKGFVVWPPEGPIDTSGPHSQFLLDKVQLAPEQYRYIQKFDSLSEKERSSILQNVKNEPFSRTWYLQLIHNIASPVFLMNSESLIAEKPLPVLAPHFLRRVSRKGFERSLEYLASKNVTVFKKSKVKDLVLQKNSMRSIEVEALGVSGVFQLEKLVWCMSSSETAHLSQRPSKDFSKILFDSLSLESEWAWMRYRVFVPPSLWLEVVPLRVTIIHDLYAPWTHENFYILQKTVTPGEFDVWLRIPSAHRFNRAYLQAMGDKLLSSLESRISFSSEKENLKISGWPQEQYYDSQTLGPARHPLYRVHERELFRERLKKASRTRGVYFDSAEMWPTLDWTGQFVHQHKIVKDLQLWKYERDLQLKNKESQL